MVRLFSLYVPLTMIGLGVIDSAVILAAWHGATALSPDAPAVPGGLLTTPALLLAGIGPILLYAMGLYDRGLRFAAAGLALRIGLAMMVAFALAASLTVPLAEPAGWHHLAGAAALASLLLLVTRALFRTGGRPRRVLVIGAGQRAREFDRLLAAGQLGQMACAGYLPVEGGRPLVAPDKVVRANDLAALCQKLGIEEIVVATDGLPPGAFAESLHACRRLGIGVIEFTTLMERELGQVPVDDPNAPWLLFGDGTSATRLNAVLKRGLDIVISLFVLVLTLPVTLMTALLILLEDGGPIFYRQERVGLNGRTFHVIKFRSMRIDAEADGKARWASLNDPRVTLVGRFIRKVRIDEIPQVWNVLRNDMSFIGPRPERPSIVEDLMREIPTFSLRHQVKPGITGWAQVRYPYGASKEDAVEKLKFDLFYVKNGGIVFDLLIILQTVRVVLFPDGAR